MQFVNGTTQVCSQPSSYVFWDSFHTTTTFNSLAATYASDLIMSALSIPNTPGTLGTITTSAAPCLRVTTVSLICALLVALLHCA